MAHENPDAKKEAEDPLASLEAFRASRQEMSAEEFGALVMDGQWDGDSARFLVYDSCYWIEILDDGRHMLTIENDGGITGPDVTLEDLEAKLFDWALEYDGPEGAPEAGPQ